MLQSHYHAESVILLWSSCYLGYFTTVLNGWELHRDASIVSLTINSNYMLQSVTVPEQCKQEAGAGNSFWRFPLFLQIMFSMIQVTGTNSKYQSWVFTVAGPKEWVFQQFLQRFYVITFNITVCKVSQHFNLVKLPLISDNVYSCDAFLLLKKIISIKYQQEHYVSQNKL